MRTMTYWTDGSCYPNPGPGGWAVYSEHSPALVGGKIHTTNNEMELTAIYKAIANASLITDLMIFSDSKWSINAITGNYHITVHRELVAEIKEWIRIRKIKGGNTKIRWVKGHGSSPQNNIADQLAGEQRKMFARLVP
jgi:ribonuclease HI